MSTIAGFTVLQVSQDVLQYWPFILLTAGLYFVAFVLLFRPVITTILHPLLYHFLLMSLSMSLTFFALHYGTATGYWILFLVHVYLVSFGFAARIFWHGGAAAVRIPLEERPEFIALFWITAAVVTIQSLTIIYSAGLLAPLGNQSQKYETLKESRLLTYAFHALDAMPFGFYWIFRKHLTMRKLALALFAIEIVGLIYSGSKQSLLLVVVFLTIGEYLRTLDGKAGRVTAKSYLLIGGGALFAISATFAIAAISGDILGFVRLMLRPIENFDQLIAMSLRDSGIQGYQQDLWQWFAAPVLKALSLFNEQYDAANQFFQVAILGINPDTEYARVNNNLVMELIFTMPTYAQLLATLLCGFVVGALFSNSIEKRYSSVIWFAIMMRLLVFPFAVLVDGTDEVMLMLIMLTIVGVIAVFGRPRAQSGLVAA